MAGEAVSASAPLRLALLAASWALSAAAAWRAASDSRIRVLRRTAEPEVNVAARVAVLVMLGFPGCVSFDALLGSSRTGNSVRSVHRKNVEMRVNSKGRKSKRKARQKVFFSHMRNFEESTVAANHVIPEASPP